MRHVNEGKNWKNAEVSMHRGRQDGQVWLNKDKHNFGGIQHSYMHVYIQLEPLISS